MRPVLVKAEAGRVALGIDAVRDIGGLYRFGILVVYNQKTRDRDLVIGDEGFFHGYVCMYQGILYRYRQFCTTAEFEWSALPCGRFDRDTKTWTWSGSWGTNEQSESLRRDVQGTLKISAIGTPVEHVTSR